MRTNGNRRMDALNYVALKEEGPPLERPWCASTRVDKSDASGVSSPALAASIALSLWRVRLRRPRLQSHLACNEPWSRLTDDGRLPDTDAETMDGAEAQRPHSSSMAKWPIRTQQHNHIQATRRSYLSWFIG